MVCTEAWLRYGTPDTEITAKEAVRDWSQEKLKRPFWDPVFGLKPRWVKLRSSRPLVTGVIRHCHLRPWRML